MTFKREHKAGLAALALALAAGAFAGAGPAFAQAAAEAAPAAAPVPNKGDTAWMLVSAILVLAMTIPGLALFYGGLVRTKNMLSVLTQVFSIVCVVTLIWVIYGYSLSFTGTGAFIGGFSKAFLAGITGDSTTDTFTKGVVIPEFVFICFQMTFACITPALIVGSFAERIKFSALLLFTVLWVTFVYFPMAHMVWFSEGFLFKMGALDFAGGTVVHINAGMAGLVGALMLGKRTGYGKEPMPPHSMTMTMIGASLLWVGWFGFNAGSNLEANGGAALAMLNTFVATAAAGMAWQFTEWAPRATPRCSARFQAQSPVLWRSRRLPASSARWARSSWALSRVSSASTRPPRSRMPWVMTTRSMSSASTASAASSARCSPAFSSLLPSAVSASPATPWAASSGRSSWRWSWRSSGAASDRRSSTRWLTSLSASGSPSRASAKGSISPTMASAPTITETDLPSLFS